MSEKKAALHEYQIAMTVNIIYLSNDAHDQGLYHMFAEILQTAQMEYQKYKFEIGDFEITKQPSDAEVADL